MKGSQDPGLQDSLHHQKGTLVGAWSAALGPGAGAGVAEGVEGPSVLPGKEKEQTTESECGDKNEKRHYKDTNQEGRGRWRAAL